MSRSSLLVPALAALLAVAIAAPASARSAPHRHLVRGPAVSTPEQYGAVGDGVHDDTAAVQAALDAGPVVLLTRTYAHTALLHLRRAGETVGGTGTLLATREATSSVWIEADGVTLTGVTLRTASTTKRWSAWEQMGLRLLGNAHDTVRGVTVVGSAAAGVYVGGAHDFLLDHVTVRDTRADGIHMTGGAGPGTVVEPTTANTGDDGVAVVSYEADGAPCHDISVSAPHVLGTTGGRGISVVGGTRVTYTGIDVERSAAAAVYVADEGAPYFTYAPHDVRVTGGRVVSANTAASIDHGAVLVVSGQSDDAPSDVTVAGLAIDDTRASASRDVGVISYGRAPSAIVLSDVAITGGPRSAYQGNAPGSSYRTLRWTKDGTVLPDHG